MYITPSLLTSKNWDDAGRVCQVVPRDHAAVLKDTHWIGGDPGKLETYGWASWTPEKGIIVLRNPSDHAQEFIPRSWRRHLSCHPTRRSVIERTAPGLQTRPSLQSRCMQASRVELLLCPFRSSRSIASHKNNGAGLVLHSSIPAPLRRCHGAIQDSARLSLQSFCPLRLPRQTRSRRSSPF
jgi:hypothetical protein